MDIKKNLIFLCLLSALYAPTSKTGQGPQKARGQAGRAPSPQMRGAAQGAQGAKQRQSGDAGNRALIQQLRNKVTDLEGQISKKSTTPNASGTEVQSLLNQIESLQKQLSSVTPAPGGGAAAETNRADAEEIKALKAELEQLKASGAGAPMPAPVPTVGVTPPPPSPSEAAGTEEKTAEEVTSEAPKEEKEKKKESVVKKAQFVKAAGASATQETSDQCIIAALQEIAFESYTNVMKLADMKSFTTLNELKTTSALDPYI